MMPEFQPFPKMARLSRECYINLKIDGTNCSVHITDDGNIFYGSRTRWITPQDDNYGFARWAEGNKSDLIKLGPGTHYAEWMGNGIQRGYGLKEKRMYLFNVGRWIKKEEDRTDSKQEVLPEILRVVPILYKGLFTTEIVENTLYDLKNRGCPEFPGWTDHEGVVVFLTAPGIYLKKTIKNDESPKGLVK